MLWVVQEAVYDVGNGEEEGDVIVGIKGVPFEKWDKIIVYLNIAQVALSSEWWKEDFFLKKK